MRERERGSAWEKQRQTDIQTQGLKQNAGVVGVFCWSNVAKDVSPNCSYFS